MYEFKIDGMNCRSCVGSITKAVQSIDSNAEIEVDIPGKSVRVDSPASLDAVKSSISDAGYVVKFSAVVE